MTIRNKFLLLLLAIFLPAFGIMVLSGFDERSREIASATNHAELLVQSMAAQQGQIAAGTKQMLSTLAQLPEVQRLDANACNELFHELNERNPYYSTISAATPDGNMFAASTPFLPNSVNLSDRKHVKDVIRTLNFSAGEYILGRVSNVHSINYTFPILDAGGSLTAIVIAGFRLDDYSEFITKAKLPEGSAVIVTDHAGVRLFRIPESEAVAPGKPLPRSTFQIISGTSDHGTFERAGEDGIERIYAFQHLRLRENAPPYLYILIGIPKDKIIEKANLEMLRNLMFLGITAALAMCLAWVFGYFTLLKPISLLSGAVRRVGGGDLATRTGLRHTPDELGKLAKSFDDMAALLETRNNESRNAEEALRESEEKYRALIETTGTGYKIMDREGVLIDANLEYARLSGHDTIQEIKGRRVAEWTAPYDREKHAEALKQIVREGFTRSLEIDYVNSSGRTTPVEVNASLIQTANGPLILSICRDITERRKAEAELQDAYEGLEVKVAERTNELGATNEQLRAEIEERKEIEEALRESRRKFEELADLLPQSVFETDANGTFTFLNQAGYATFEVAPADLEGGLSFQDLIVPEETKKLEDYRSRILAGEKISFLEVSALNKKSGSKFPAALYSSVIYASGIETGIRGIFVDLSERKKMEAELRRAEKLESIGQLAAGIAHEINTPAQYTGDNIRFLEESFKGLERVFELYDSLVDSLRTGKPYENIIGKIEATAGESDLEYIREEIPNAILQSMEGIERISEIVLAMKEFSHPGADEKKNIDLNRAIENTITVARNEWKYVADVVTDFDPNLPLVPCLPGEINQVVLNMIVNAAHAITEKLKDGLEQKGMITVATRRRAECAEILIRDTGNGIREEIRSKIFDPFFTTKEVGKGTGQGLAISHSVIVDKHSGSISFETEGGVGTTFIVRLPILDTPGQEEHR
jgi:PAS domain S-box-containing protein